MSPLFMMCKDGHLYERNHQVSCHSDTPRMRVIVPLTQHIVSDTLRCSATP